MAYRQSDSQRRNDVVRFDLMERIGVLSIKDNGWTREVNIVSWNNGKAKVDIREWDPDHKRMTKGVTLFEEEAETLTRLLATRYGLRLGESDHAHRAFTKVEGDRRFFSGGRSYEAAGRFPGEPATGPSGEAGNTEDAAGLPEGGPELSGSAYDPAEQQEAEAGPYGQGFGATWQTETEADPYGSAFGTAGAGASADEAAEEAAVRDYDPGDAAAAAACGEEGA